MTQKTSIRSGGIAHLLLRGERDQVDRLPELAVEAEFVVEWRFG
jgi:hypothetical protein